MLIMIFSNNVHNLYFNQIPVLLHYGVDLETYWYNISWLSFAAVSRRIYSLIGYLFYHRDELRHALFHVYRVNMSGWTILVEESLMCPLEHWSNWLTQGRFKLLTMKERYLTLAIVPMDLFSCQVILKIVLHCLYLFLWRDTQIKIYSVSCQMSCKCD